MTKKKPTIFEIANTCNACGQQMERGAVMVCHECAGKRVLHPTPLKIGETIRWKKDGDSPVLEKSDLLKKVFFIRAGDPKAGVLSGDAIQEIRKWRDAGIGFDIVLERRDDGPDAVCLR